MKKVFKIIWTLFLCKLFCINLMSQNDAFNHQKYWYYRTRLVNDFVKVGLNQGESLPFNQRAIETYGMPGVPTNTLGNGLKVGDGVSTLGEYIAVLATEYALLAKNNQSTVKVKHELFCALNAFNRLDYNAEPEFSWGAHPQPSLNGFIIRSDIPYYFARDNYEHFNYYNNGVDADPWGDGHPLPPAVIINGQPDYGANDRGFTSIVKRGQWISSSEYSAVHPPPNGDPATSPDNNNQSQKQVHKELKFINFSIKQNSKLKK